MTNKRILYILQQSILSNSKLWLSADSNINMASGFFTAWIAHNNMEGFEVDVVIAPMSHFEDITSAREVFPEHPNLNFVELPMTKNAALNRLDFRSWGMQNVLQNGAYDLIISCTPEWVLGIKTVYRILQLEGPPIITQCFWLDTPEIGEPKQPKDITLQWRQAEGFLLSDLVVFTCKSTKEAWVGNAVKTLAPGPILQVLNKSVIWDFGYSENEISSHAFTIAQRNLDRARIGFLNRLGSDNYTNAPLFIDALRILANDDNYKDRFEVVFTNPSKRVTEEWLVANVPNFVSFDGGQPLSRSRYLELIYSCDITAHLFTKERYGGCALRESIAALNYTVVADCHEQGRLVQDPKLKIDVNNLTPEGVARALRYAIDCATQHMTTDEWMEATDYREQTVEKNYEQCSFEKQIYTFLADIKKVIGE